MAIAYDLTALQKDLSTRPQHKELGRKIARFSAARSLEQDLSSALAAIDALKEIDGTDGVQRIKFGRPLMTQAIMMYCRASIEDNRGRSGISVTKGFTKEQIRKHQDVVKLRNKNIGHFGAGEGSYGERWISEKVVLKYEDDGSIVAIDVWQRTNYLADLINDLEDLCSAALENIEAEGSRLQRELTEHIAITSDHELVDLIRMHVFNAAEFFSSPEVAADFRAPEGMLHEVYIPKMKTPDGMVQISPPISTKLRR